MTSTYLTGTLTASMAKLELRDLVSWRGFVTIAALPIGALAGVS